jgi:hypothetical protein
MHTWASRCTTKPRWARKKRASSLSSSLRPTVTGKREFAARFSPFANLMHPQSASKAIPITQCVRSIPSAGAEASLSHCPSNPPSGGRARSGRRRECSRLPYSGSREVRNPGRPRSKARARRCCAAASAVPARGWLSPIETRRSAQCIDCPLANSVAEIDGVAAR